MMTESEVLAEVAEVARRHVGIEAPLNPALRLVEDLELDSIKMLTLAVEVENHFRIAIDPDSEAEIVTVGDLVGIIRSTLDDSR